MKSWSARMPHYNLNFIFIQFNPHHNIKIELSQGMAVNIFSLHIFK